LKGKQREAANAFSELNSQSFNNTKP